MGGRGSSNGGIASYNNMNVNYPDMDGSEKQVQYAKDLIDKYVNKAVEGIKYEYAVIERRKERYSNKLKKDSTDENAKKILKEDALGKKILNDYTKELRSSLKGNIRDSLGDNIQRYKSKESEKLYAGFVIKNPESFVRSISTKAIKKVLKKYNIGYDDYVNNMITDTFMSTIY